MIAATHTPTMDSGRLAVLAVALVGLAGRVAAHPGHGALHTTGGRVSVALLTCCGLAVLGGVARLYASDAVGARGAGVGGVLGASLLASAALLVWPVV